MWTDVKNFPAKGFSTPPPTWKTRPALQSPLSERKHQSPSSCKPDLFHVMHKVPAGDSPYVRAKHVQLIDKEPSKAISLFWAAINSGDRVDSALKDMAVAMKQLNRSEEAIEAIKSFRHLCPLESQESLDNLLVELYKRSGRIEDEIEMLQHKLKRIEDNMAFGRKRTKTARSQGKKIQITVDQERSRILGNLAWAYLQQYNYGTAEELYRKALALEPDNNKQCNLAICLMHMNRIREAKSLLQSLGPSCKDRHMDDSFAKSFGRAFQMLSELESSSSVPTSNELGEDHKNQRSVTSPINRISKETTILTSQSRDHDSCFVVSGSSPYGNGEGTVLLSEQNKVSHCRNYHGSNDTFSGRDEGNSKYTLFGTVSSIPLYSPETAFYNEWKEGGASFGNSFGRRSDFSSRRKENWVGMTGTSVGSSVQKKGFISSPSPVRAIPKIPSTEPRRGSWFLREGDHRRGFWGDDAVGGSCHRPSFEHGEAQRQSMPMESRRFVGNERIETFVGKGGRYSTDATPSCSMGVKDGENECLGKINIGLSPLVSENPMPNPCRKKSWADMAEEEEQELLSVRMENVENLNSNIICQPNLMENLNKSLESFDLKDDHVTSGNAISSRNTTVRRSLCFDQQQNPDPVEYCCASPLPKKALDFEGDSFALADETGEFSLGKYITPPMRRNRLQVFQNITLLPESP